MAFRAILQGIVEQCEGALGSVVMGYDGIAIEEFLAEEGPLDVQLLAVEYASILKEIKRTAGVLQIGDLEEVSIVSDSCRVIVRGVSEDFFVALIQAPDGNYGKGRYLLRRDAPKLKEALS